MDWVFQSLNSNHNIPNFSIRECCDLLGVKFGEEIGLQEYMLATVGRIQGKKCVAIIRLLQNIERHKPLQGIHHVQLLYTTTPHQPSSWASCWVSSLSTLRRQLLCFEDHLSFERSTFLILHDTHHLIRLKCLRSLFTLPCIPAASLPTTPLLGCCPVTMYSLQKKQCQLTSRTRSQFERHLEQMFTSYVRDLYIDFPSKQHILEILKDDILNHLTKLETMNE